MKGQITIKEFGDSFLLCIGGSPERIFSNYEKALKLKLELQEEYSKKMKRESAKRHYQKKKEQKQ